MTADDQHMNEERIEWVGRSSQLQNLGWFLACLLVLPIPVAIYRWLETRTQVYTLTNQRLKTTRGILSKLTEDLELYRVRDTRLQQTFWQRLFGLGEVVLNTTDASTPDVRLRWLPDAEALRERLRVLVEARRDEKGVRTLEGGHEIVP
jgi:uncharacterized membrane protein YdbT with pleckstrin-like domain